MQTDSNLGQLSLLPSVGW